MIDLTKIKTIAVVGASNNPDKFGNKIVENLNARKFIVLPINLHEEKIQGLKVFKTLAELPIVPDLVDVVVPPEIALEVVMQAIKLGIKNIWIQPGAESDDVINYLTQSGVNFVARACIMV